MKKGRALLQAIKITQTAASQSQILLMGSSDRYCYRPNLLWNPQVEEYFKKAYGAEAFSLISKSLTQPSCYSCIRVNTLRSTNDSVIEKILGILQEQKLLNSLHNLDMTDDAESLPLHKHSGAWDVLCSQNGTALEIPGSVPPLKTSAQTSPVLKCQIPGLDYVVFVKGSGPHAIDYGNQQNKPPKEVIVSRKCAEAVLRGAKVYVPGILACSAHVEKGDVVAVSVGVEQPGRDGGWGIEITRGTILQGLQTDPHYLERDGLYIGQGITMMSRATIFRELSGVALDMSDRVFRLPSFNDVLKGDIFLQNLPSIIVAHALDPQEGERILDMCAAPGGKTTAIASLMKDKGEVVAVDRSHNKVLEIQNLAVELGLNNIVAYKLDALKAVRKSKLNGIMFKDSSEDRTGLTSQDVESVRLYAKNLSSDIKETTETDLTGNKISNTVPTSNEVNISVGEKIKEGGCRSKAKPAKQNRGTKNGPGRNHSSGGRADKCEGFPPNSFDRVLLDAPCSALGLRPRLFAGEETLESLRKHATYQKRMFDQAVQLVRPGGVIVYSTCTINPGENEALVRYALDAYKFLSLAPQHPRVGGPGLVGHFESSDGYFEEWLRPGEEDLVQKFDPSSPLDTIGFFIAKFNVGHKDA